MELESCQEAVSNSAYGRVNAHNHIAQDSDLYVNLRKMAGPNRAGMYGPGCLFPDPPKDFVRVVLI